jgi:D-glycero-D-manno-heptose 1,7-bisphosphate phosphatase
LALDLGRSVLVGDKASDLEAARAVGCRTVLVRSGYGRAVELELGATHRLSLADLVSDSLLSALPFLEGTF